MPSDEVIYSCPFVPPGLVRAYGLRPRRLIPDVASTAASRSGVCPFAHDFTQAAMALPAAGIVFTTLCDQMRRQAEVAAAGGKTPVFCLNVPRTWQDPACEQYYLAELRRLGRFLEGIGGRRPSDSELAAAIAEEATERTKATTSPRGAGGLNDNDNSHGNGNDIPPQCGGLQQQQQQQQQRQQQRQQHPLAVRGALTATATTAKTTTAKTTTATATTNAPTLATVGAVPIALVGGPIAAGNWLFELLAELGLHVALDATETGLAGWPDVGGQLGASADPLARLAATYFAGIHHPSRFPADHLYDWLVPLLARSGAQAIVLRYYAWCDPWHAQAHRLAQRSGLSVVEIDGRETPGRARTRLGAIAEMAK